MWFQFNFNVTMLEFIEAQSIYRKTLAWYQKDNVFGHMQLIIMDRCKQFTQCAKHCLRNEPSLFWNSRKSDETSNDVPTCVDEKLEAKVATDDMFASMASDTTHDHTVLNHQVGGRLVTDLHFNHHRYAVTTAVLSNAIAAKQTVSTHLRMAKFLQQQFLIRSQAEAG